MTWERFHYVCRRAANSTRDDEPLADTIKRIEQEPGTALYGPAGAKPLITGQILQDICALERNEVGGVLALYGKLDLAGQLEEPLRFKRVLIYLGYVTFVFSVVAGIYQTRITPNFISTFQTFDIPVPSDMLWFQQYGWHLSMAILIILLLGLLIGYRLRELFSYRLGTRGSFAFKYLTLRSIKTPYLNILEAIHFPLRATALREDMPRSEITAHLEQLESTGMDISREIQELVRREGILLTARCERQMRIITTVMALVIIASIWFFLQSAYLPIFIMGDQVQ